MEKPIDKLQILKERYEAEKLQGDLSDATRMAKVSYPHAISALKKETWESLTKSERKTMSCLQRILDERKREEAEFEV